MNRAFRAAAIVAALAAVTGSAALAASTPAPKANPTPHPTRTLLIHLPTVPLHTEMVVEVNKKGQVVRVKSTKWCKVSSFNVQTFGNALQMWIRRPNGTAQVGLYRVTYDYNPKKGMVERHVAIISRGGTWGDQEGAADRLMRMAHEQAIKAQQAQMEAQKKAQERNTKLPSLNEIRGVHSTPSPKPSFLPPY